MGETYCTTDGTFQIPDLTAVFLKHSLNLHRKKKKQEWEGEGWREGEGKEGATEENEMRDGERLGRRKEEKKEVLRGTILQQTKSS